MRLITLPVLSHGRDTGSSIDVVSCLLIKALPDQVQCLGYRLTQTARGRLAVERIH